MSAKMELIAYQQEGVKRVYLSPPVGALPIPNARNFPAEYTQLMKL
jgi:hypothetical protein